MKFCFNCGAQIIENSKECPCCGINLLQPENRQNSIKAVLKEKKNEIKGQITNAYNAYKESDISKDIDAAFKAGMADASKNSKIISGINAAYMAGVDNKAQRAKQVKTELPEDMVKDFNHDEKSKIVETRNSSKPNLDFEKQIDVIRKVKELQNDGIISEEEFKDKVRIIFDL